MVDLTLARNTVEMTKTKERKVQNTKSATSECYLDAVGLAYKLVDSAKKHLNTYLRQYHIKFSHWYLLKSIMFDDANTPSELALCMGTDRAAVTRLLDELEVRSLIERKRNKQDRRVVTIELTDKGKSLIHKGIQSLQTLPDLLNKRLDARELNTIRHLEIYHHENDNKQTTAKVS